MTHIITGLEDGGAEAVLCRLCLAGAARSTTVVSLSPPGKYSDPLRQAGIEVVHLNMPRGRVTARGLWTLYALLLRRHPDVVQTWMYHGDLVGGVVARLAGCRNVVWNVRHSDLEHKSTGRSTRLVAALCARLSKIVPYRIVACAERAREVHSTLGYDASKFTIIPNGYDIARFRPDPAARAALRAELGLDEDEIAVGLVGRWNPQKDHRSLLKAVSRLPETQRVTVILAGLDCDAANPTLTALVEEFELADRVRLLGRRNDVPALMNALDLHVLSSSHGEAFPNVVAEAMACGTPCVVTDVGDAAMIVGETGWVVSPRNTDALAAAIAAALDERTNATAWARRRAAARERIGGNFSLGQMVARYRAVWAETAAAGR